MSLSNWWGQRFAEASAAVVPESRARGGRRSRAARLMKLDPKTGEAQLDISSSSLTPYQVKVAMQPIPPEIWSAAMQALSTEAKHVARLLSGELPIEIEEAFARAGRSLFPSPDELSIKCNCPAAPGGCRHGGLALRALAEAVDRDAFLIFDLRGRPRADVLSALGVASVHAPASGASPAATKPEPEAPIDAASFRRARGDLAAVRFHVEAPEVSRALLARLGDPPGWKGPPDFADAIGAAVEHAAARARTIAIGDEQS